MVGVLVAARVLPATQGTAVKVVAASGGATMSARLGVEIPAVPPAMATATRTANPTAIRTENPTAIRTENPTAIRTENPTAESDGLTREVALLEKARRSLQRDPAGALAMLNVYAAEFPTGTLGMEKELLAVEVLRRLGRAADARARGEALLVRTRGSIYEERVTGMLDALGTP
jgi:hypothetical protein